MRVYTTSQWLQNLYTEGTTLAQIGARSCCFGRGNGGTTLDVDLAGFDFDVVGFNFFFGRSGDDAAVAHVELRAVPWALHGAANDSAI